MMSVSSCPPGVPWFVVKGDSLCKELAVEEKSLA